MSNHKWIVPWLAICGLGLGSACLHGPDDDDSQGGAGGEGTPGGAPGSGGERSGAAGIGPGGEAGLGASAGYAGYGVGGVAGPGGGGVDGLGGGGEGQAGSGGAEECPTNSNLDSPRVKWLGACTPLGLSDDGTTVLAREGIWRAPSGWTPLPDLSADAANTPMLLSGDGQVVFGCSRSDSGSQLYRWTAEAGISGLGAPCPGESGEYADRLGTNADGSTLVTCGISGNHDVLLRWSLDDGFRVVEGATPGEVCQAYSASMSSNGATIIADNGYANLPGLLFIQSSTTVSVLRDLLVNQAMVSAVSGDGRVVADYYDPANFDNGASVEAALCLFPGCAYAPLTVITSLNHDGSAGIGVQEEPREWPSPEPILHAQFYWTNSASASSIRTTPLG